MSALAVPFRYAIVEDERLARIFLKESLKKLAPQAELVWEADNGENAISFLQHVKVDVLFLDVCFPPDDAFGLLEKVKAIGLEIPQIIFVSAHTEPALQAFEWAARDYLVKPFTSARLAQTLDRIYMKLASEDMKAITESLSDVVWVMNPDFSLQYISPAIQRLTDFTPDEALKAPLEKRYPAETVAKMKEFFQQVQHSSDGKSSFTLEVELYRKDGSTISCEVRFQLVRNELGRLMKAHGTTTDITQRKRAEAELTRLATLDPLTGIFNRSYFTKQLSYEINRYRRYKRVCSLIMADIDFFKQVNDTYGHLAGDKAIMLFSSTVSLQLRKTDIFCRLGGEEFAILLPEVDAKGALIFAERLRTSVEDLKLEFEGHAIHFTASFGITQLHSNDSYPESVIGRADSALYESKHKGRNRVCVHLAEDSNEAQN